LGLIVIKHPSQDINTEDMMLLLVVSYGLT